MALFHINSKYRDSGDINNFTYLFNTTQCLHSVKLLEVQIPLSWYVINESNNVFTFTEDSSPLTFRQVILTNGNYDSTSICTEIKSQMEAVGSQLYTVTFNSITSTITISSVSTFGILWTSSPKLARRLGFSDVTNGLSHTSSFPINLSPSDVYFLNIEGFGISPLIKSHKQPTVGNYPIAVVGASNELFTWSNQLYPKVPTTVTSGNIRISLYDSDGTLVPLLTDWSISFELK